MNLWRGSRETYTTLANMAKQAEAVLKTDKLDASDRGYFSSLEILGCHEAGITVTLPEPKTSGAKSEGASKSRRRDDSLVSR